VAGIDRQGHHDDSSREGGSPREGRCGSADALHAPAQILRENLHGADASLMTARPRCGTATDPKILPDKVPRAIAQSGPIVLSENASFLCFGWQKPSASARSYPGTGSHSSGPCLAVAASTHRLDALAPGHYRSRNIFALGPLVGAGRAKVLSFRFLEE
jgi:hypothetical protein